MMDGCDYMMDDDEEGNLLTNESFPPACYAVGCSVLGRVSLRLTIRHLLVVTIYEEEYW